jgi:hypothetical protein
MDDSPAGRKYGVFWVLYRLPLNSRVNLWISRVDSKATKEFVVALLSDGVARVMLS